MIYRPWVAASSSRAMNTSSSEAGTVRALGHTRSRRPRATASPERSAVSGLHRRRRRTCIRSPNTRTSTTAGMRLDAPGSRAAWSAT